MKFLHSGPVRHRSMLGHHSQLDHTTPQRRVLCVLCGTKPAPGNQGRPRLLKVGVGRPKAIENSHTLHPAIELSFLNFSLCGPNPLCTLFSSIENHSLHIKWGIPLFYNHSFSLEWPSTQDRAWPWHSVFNMWKNQWMSIWMKDGRTKPSFAFLNSNNTLLTSSRQSIRIVWFLWI